MNACALNYVLISVISKIHYNACKRREFEKRKLVQFPHWVNLLNTNGKVREMLHTIYNIWIQANKLERAMSRWPLRYASVGSALVFALQYAKGLTWRDKYICSTISVSS